MNNPDLQQKVKDSLMDNPELNRKINQAKEKGENVLKYVSHHPVKSFVIGMMASWVVKKCLL